MSAPTVLQNLLESLPQSANKTEKLEEIKTILLALNHADLKFVVNNISFNVIFESLQTKDSHQLKLCTEVLDHLLSSIDGANLLENFNQELLSGMQNGEEMVKSLCLRQVKRACVENPVVLGPYDSMILTLISMLADKLPIAKVAAQCLTIIGSVSNGSQFLLTGPCLEKMSSVMGKDDTVRYRAYEVVVDIAKLTPDNLQLGLSSGIITQLTNEIHKDDILVQLNCLEMLAQLSTSLHCLQYLDQQGIIARLEKMLANVDSDPMAGFLLPGLIKFFGNVAHQYPKEICDRFQTFINLVFGTIDGNDQSLATIAIETLGVIGSSTEGKRALENQDGRMVAACKTIGNLVQSASSEFRVRAIESIASLLQLHERDQLNDLLYITEKWFKSLNNKTMDVLMSLAKQPFTELRCGTLNIFRVIANQAWGQRTLLDYPGWVEYILDRSTEHTKEGKDAKFDVIKAVIDSSTAQEIFGNVYFVRLREYVNRGPYYVRVEAAVAMESTD